MCRRSEILELFDSIILLAGGKCIFVGSVDAGVQHFASLGIKCPPQTNPSDFFLDTMTLDFRSDKLKEESAARIKALQDKWESMPREGGQPALKLEEAPKACETWTAQTDWSNSFVVEFLILLDRGFKDLLRNPANIGASMGQATILIIIVGPVCSPCQTLPAYMSLSTVRRPVLASDAGFGRRPEPYRIPVRLSDVMLLLSRVCVNRPALQVHDHDQPNVGTVAADGPSSRI